MITLSLRYTINPNKLDAFATYTAAEQIPIRESGGDIIGYFLPTDFAGPTNEAFGLIEFGWAVAELGDPNDGIDKMQRGLAEYEATGAKLRSPYFLG